MKKLLAAALMVVLASPAFAAIQNVKVSGDLTTTFVDRSNFDLGLTNNLLGDDIGNSNNSLPYGLKKQNVFITQTRIRVDADLSDNVSTTVGLINERAWNAENSTGAPNYANDTNVQLYLASITMRELLYSPLTVQIGRQVFNYGNGLILGDGGAINQGSGNLQFIDQDLTERTAYDGVTATLDYKPLTISMIYFKNNQGDLSGGPESGQTSSDVFGYNANYQLSDPWSTVVEQYVFARIDGHDNASAFDATSGVTDKNDTLFVPGLRASTNPTKDINLQGELAWQIGNHPVVSATGASTQQSEHRDAMAAQFLASYSLPVLDKYKPTLNASYTYVSGDKNADENYAGDHISSAKTYTAWDPFNEIQGAGTIYRTLYPMSNESIVTAGASASPLEDVTAAFTWSGLWAVSPYSTQNPLQIFQPDNGANLVTVPTKHNAYGLGNEYDVNLTYNYTEDVTFGVTLGWYVPGSALADTNKDTASEALANVGVKF
jgi:hypothetical protein